MAQVIVTESSLENIAGAIRAKLGTQDTYKPAQMAGAIAQIHGDPVLEALNVNANGTYTPSSGKDGFSQAMVNVPNSYSSGDEGKVVSGGALVAQSSQSITQNGTYDTTLKNQVTVNVSGGGGDVVLMSEDDWEALTTAQKQSYGLVAIQMLNSGYIRGELINGADYIPIDFYDYILFNSASMDLPFTLNSDYKITVEFNEMAYRNDEHIIGNTQSSVYIHLTPYNNRWFTSIGTSETSFGGYQFNEKHTFVSNVNGKNTMDGVEVTNYTPYTNYNIRYTIGSRPGGTYQGRIYSYKIESISTGRVLLNLKPALINNQSVLYDKVSRTIIPFTTGSGTVGNDTE